MCVFDILLFHKILHLKIHYFAFKLVNLQLFLCGALHDLV